jgi:y4mF family transcriptional regulator
VEIGAFVRQRRRALNLTQQQLADRAGVGLNFVYQLEKEKPTVQLDCARQVLQALGYDLAVHPRDGMADTDSTAWADLPRPAARPNLPWD